MADDNQQPDFNELMNKAKEMQTQMKDVQDRIAQFKVVGESGGGLIKVTMNGTHSAEKVEVSKSVMAEDDEAMLGDLIAAAINDASTKIEQATREEMMKVAKDLDLPESPMDDESDSGSSQNNELGYDDDSNR